MWQLSVTSHGGVPEENSRASGGRVISLLCLLIGSGEGPLLHLASQELSSSLLFSALQAHKVLLNQGCLLANLVILIPTLEGETVLMGLTLIPDTSEEQGSVPRKEGWPPEVLLGCFLPMEWPCQTRSPASLRVLGTVVLCVVSMAVDRRDRQPGGSLACSLSSVLAHLPLVGSHPLHSS